MSALIHFAPQEMVPHVVYKFYMNECVHLYISKRNLAFSITLILEEEVAVKDEGIYWTIFSALS